MKATPLVLFMKGTPDLPQCGFSRAVCQILEVQGVKYDKMKTFNCLEDPELRDGIKEYSFVFRSAQRCTLSSLVQFTQLLADDSSALYQGGVCGRLRYRSRYASVRRVGNYASRS